MIMNSFPGTKVESDEYRLFTLRNANDMSVTISEHGGMLCSWRAPDRYGRMAEVLELTGALSSQMVAASGGHTGDAAALQQGALRWHGRRAEGGVSLLAPAGLEGTSAGTLINYCLDDDGSLIINYHAVSSLPAPLGRAPTPSFNLNGGHADVSDHLLRLGADYYVEVDGGGMPAGVAAVAGTPFDFRQSAPIGPRLAWPDSQISLVGGFDHCFFVRSHFSGGQGPLREVASVVDLGSGRRLQMYTTEAALHFSAGDQLRGATLAGVARASFGLETAARPSLTSAAWPHVILTPGQVYRQTTVYRLSLQV